MPPRSAPPSARGPRGRFVAGGKAAPAAAEGRAGRLRRFLWSGVVLGGLGLVGAAASDFAKGALKERFGAFATGQYACAAREWWARSLGGPPAPADPGQFRVLVARLHDDDGRLSEQVARGFVGERGFVVVKTCRTVALDGENVTAASIDAEREAEKLRAGRGADLIVWGQVADAGSGAVRLWFSAESVRPNMARAPWKIEQGTLGGGFQKEFALALQAMAVAALPPASDAQKQAVVALLRPLLPPLRVLVAQPPEGLPQEDRIALRRSLALALQTFGDQAGDNAALREAIEQHRRLSNEMPREQSPLQWALTQNNLGNALWKLGEREAGAARLEEAVVAFREALAEATRERAPLQWALTQNNLGSALWALGEREAGTARLEEAVGAFREALGYATRERAPIQWAATQNNLGTVLRALGEREAGTARLEEAVAAYGLALEERTRERAPRQRITTQNNLASTLQELGEREAGTVRLEELVAVYRGLLEERTRERAPLDWAATQHNLGSALWKLGLREPGTERLQEAAAANGLALEERTRERAPLHWAATQNNLGTVLAALGEREPGTARLEEAVAVYRAALEERTREKAPLEWAVTMENLAAAEEAWAERTGDESHVRAALAACEGALDEYRRARADHHIQTATRLRDRLAAKLAALPEAAKRPGD